ncbi:MAG: YIP1 family protein [Ignavibacteriae bacterium]|nr:MAG: YIP1 family protein [Ignavibacteriota bacterium]
MSLIDRAKNIMLSPKTEWEAVANEEPNVQQILVSYVLPLALIPTVAIIIGWGVIGVWGFTSFNYGIAVGLVQLLNAFIAVLLTAFVIDALAPSFGSQKNYGKALQLVAYSMTPVWIAGILNVIPSIGWLGSLIGLYGLFLLYLGITPMMKTPEDKRVGYLIVSIIILLVVYFIVAAILTAILFAAFGLSAFTAARF